MTTAVQVNNLLEEDLLDLEFSCAEVTRLAVTMPHALRPSTVTAEYYRIAQPLGWVNHLIDLAGAVPDKRRNR